MTYAFNPSAADIILNAFDMLQIRATELTTQHLERAALQANLLMVDISNRNPHQWTLEAVTQTLIASQATYTLPARTLAVVVATLTIGAGGTARDRTLQPISASDYAMQPNKAHAAPPTSYWFGLTSVPTLTLWPVPTSATPGPLNLQTLRQVGDVGLANGATFDSPYRFLDAITTGLAARLADMYRPEKADRFNLLYEQRMVLAQKRDEETVNVRIQPEFGSYYR